MKNPLNFSEPMQEFLLAPSFTYLVHHQLPRNLEQINENVFCFVKA